MMQARSCAAIAAVIVLHAVSISHAASLPSFDLGRSGSGAFDNSAQHELEKRAPPPPPGVQVWALDKAGSALCRDNRTIGSNDIIYWPDVHSDADARSVVRDLPAGCDQHSELPEHVWLALPIGPVPTSASDGSTVAVDMLAAAKNSTKQQPPQQQQQKTEYVSWAIGCQRANNVTNHVHCCWDKVGYVVFDQDANHELTGKAQFTPCDRGYGTSFKLMV